MAEENEPTAGKKRRIIHWNPEAGNTAVKRRWTLPRILAWSVGGFFGLILVAGLAIRGVKLVFGPEVFQGSSVTAASEGPAVTPELAFVSQSKAELSRETADRALSELRRLPQDHPVQLQRLVLMQKAFIGGESLLASGNYTRAYTHFETLNREIDDFSTSLKNKQEAQLAYDEILLKIKELDRARSLAPEALDAAFEAASMGRQFLGEGSFSMAKRALDDGFVELRKAETALEDFIQDNLIAGQEALGRGDRDGAALAFRAALDKSPGNELALQGLTRSETIDRVHALLEQGRTLEAEARYAEAAKAYAEAFALDAFSAAAQQGQTRASRLEKETKFDGAYSIAQKAFEERRWEAAISGYEEALKVYPDKDEVRDQLRKARENAHTDAVEAALARAYAFENRHEWAAAREAYDRTIQLDPNHEEAKEGYARAGQVIRALIEYEKRIEAAEERALRAEFQMAIRIFNEAMAVKPSYLANSERVNQLHALLMSQNTPVDVTFNSDGRTWVSISNFRMLGQFNTTTLKIMPGDYEVVGRRKGYQDVLLLLQVRNGSYPPVVSVTCTLRADR